MKVLHTDFHRGWGGQAARVLMLCRRIAEGGHEAEIAAPPGELARRAREAGIPVDDSYAFRPPAELLSFAADVRRLARRLREGGFDILHTHGSQDTWVGAVTRALTGRPAVFMATRHNTKRVRYNAANRYLYGRALDHLVLAAGGVRDRFRPFLDAGLLNDERMTVVHSAYRTELFDAAADPEPLRRELGLEGRRPLIGVIARLARDKGHVFLFRAMEEILAAHPGALLLVAGLGPAEKELRDQAAALGLGDSVKFLGFRDDVPALTALLDVAVLPSIGCDASSASIKEAMATARPVVATDVGGAREILRDGRTGRVVPPGDPGALAEAILAILTDPDGARAMGHAARDDVRSRFTPGRLGDESLALYRRLLDRAGAAGARARTATAGPGAERR